MAGRHANRCKLSTFDLERVSRLRMPLPRQAIIIAWRFAVLGDFEVDELEGQEGRDMSISWCHGMSC